MKNYFSFIPKYALLIAIPLLISCGTSGYEPTEESKQEEIAKSPAVPADGVLEAVTWNLEWYGDATYGDSHNGPLDEHRQTLHIVEVMDSLQADLYAFQEVYGPRALQDITRHLSGYKGFVAQEIDWIQKTAFVYNTKTIDSLSAGLITNGQDFEDWTYGRYPFYFRFRYNYKNKSEMFYAVVIHAKAYDEKESYERRKRAARDLYDYLKSQKPEANIIFLGDYNDDVDVSIYSEAPSPYQPFVTDTANFWVITKALSEAGKASTVSYPDMVDHITISDELFNAYIGGSAAVFVPTEKFIPFYGNTTSDHYPVWAKFDVGE